eukprot:5571685-Pleurochrysis_carterae.AAC.3
MAEMKPRSSASSRVKRPPSLLRTSSTPTTRFEPGMRTGSATTDLVRKPVLRSISHDHTLEVDGS